LDADQKTSSPFYVHVNVKNVGDEDLSDSSPGRAVDRVRREEREVELGLEGGPGLS